MLSQLLALFGFFALVLVSVYWVNRAVRLFDRLIADGQSAWVFLEFTALTLPYVIRLVLPVAAFVATVYVTNRLSRDSELVVMQATGFSPWRLARPVAYFGLVVAALMTVLVHVLVPVSRDRLAERNDEIAASMTSRFLVAGSFLHPAAGITLYIRSVTPQGELRDLFLSDRRDLEAQTTYTARSAALVRSDSGPKLVMFDGMAQRLDAAGGRLAVTRFADSSYDIGALVAAQGERRPRIDEFVTPALLRDPQAALEASGASPALLAYELHDRFSQPFMALVAALLGFSALLTGGFSRFGVWRQIGVAISAMILVMGLSNAAADAVGRAPSLWPLLYAPIAVGLAIAGAMLWLAGRGRRGGRLPPAPGASPPGVVPGAPA